MTTLITTAVLQVMVAAAPAETAAAEASYTQALSRSMTQGKPLVVLVGADWCAACVRMKNTTLPQVEKAGGLKQVEFAYVDRDRQPKLASQLTRGGPIPQLIRLKKTQKGVERHRLVGAQNAKKVTTFVSHK
jgi:thioredoxin-like negative regulator of GroEL